MKHKETNYRATLLTWRQTKIPNVKVVFDGTYKVAKEMWASYFGDGKTCVTHFFDNGNDEELYKLGYLKVIKMERVDVYEERIVEYDLDLETENTDN